MHVCANAGTGVYLLIQFEAVVHLVGCVLTRISLQQIKRSCTISPWTKQALFSAGMESFGHCGPCLLLAHGRLVLV